MQFGSIVETDEPELDAGPGRPVGFPLSQLDPLGKGVGKIFCGVSDCCVPPHPTRIKTIQNAMNIVAFNIF